MEPLAFPDWETLPYDRFSPYQDIVSERLATLYRLPELPGGIVIASVTTLMQRLPPRSFLERNTLMLRTGALSAPLFARTRIRIRGRRVYTRKRTMI